VRFNSIFLVVSVQSQFSVLKKIIVFILIYFLELVIFSPDRNGYPFLKKPIFSGSKTTTIGSSFLNQEKKVLEKKIIVDSRIGFRQVS